MRVPQQRQQLPRDVARAIDDGSMCVVGEEIVEPIVQLADQESAIVRAQRLHAATGGEYSVVMSTEI